MVNLGALFASGVTPQQLGDFTWPQVSLVSEAIQLYHIDLATRLITGKSGVAEAEQAQGVQAGRRWLHQDPDEVSAEEAKRIAEAELAELANFVGGPLGGVGGYGGIAVKVSGSPGTP